jgi:hypothetical protein
MESAVGFIQSPIPSFLGRNSNWHNIRQTHLRHGDEFPPNSRGGIRHRRFPGRGGFIEFCTSESPSVSSGFSAVLCPKVLAHSTRRPLTDPFRKDSIHRPGVPPSGLANCEAERSRSYAIVGSVQEFRWPEDIPCSTAERQQKAPLSLFRCSQLDESARSWADSEVGHEIGERVTVKVAPHCPQFHAHARPTTAAIGSRTLSA